MMIQTAVQRLVKNRTTFVIAHRLSTVHSADLIVVLENGKIMETGRHQELITKDGLYNRLYKIQFKSMPTAPDEDFSTDVELLNEDFIESGKADQESFDKWGNKISES